jgi:heme/copper-type cytochrome/quinol oxidase subunit 2
MTRRKKGGGDAPQSLADVVNADWCIIIAIVFAIIFIILFHFLIKYVTTQEAAGKSVYPFTD